MKSLKLRILGIFVISILVGCSLVFVVRGTNGLPLYISPKAISDLQVNIEAESKEVQILNDRMVEAEIKLNEYEMLFKSDNTQLQEKLLEELEYYKLVSGETDVKGPGVTVFVDDGTRELNEGENINMLLVHDQDVLTILNELKKAGAEAISVNGQRIVNTSSISCSGYTIRINGIFFARPFEIKAIGNAKAMAGALTGPEGYATILKLWGVMCNVKPEEEILIPKYKGNQNYKNATKVKEGE